MLVRTYFLAGSWGREMGKDAVRMAFGAPQDRTGGRVKSFEPYRKRRVRGAGVWEAAGWRIKLYVIAYRGDAPRPEVVDAAKRVAETGLPQPPTTEDRYGVGFLIVHDGRDGCWCLIDWWGEEDILFHRLFAAPSDRPWEMWPATDGRTACVWELAVWGFERRAWMEHVLANPAGPDLERYLAAQMDAEV